MRSLIHASSLILSSLSLLPSQDEDSLPVDIMLILLDELFDLRADSQWLRRQLPTLLKQLAGDKLSRKVVGYSDWFVSSEQVACYLRDFRATMWPNGKLAPSKPQQSVEMKALRSLLARAKLIGNLPGNTMYVRLRYCNTSCFWTSPLGRPSKNSSSMMGGLPWSLSSYNL